MGFMNIESLLDWALAKHLKRGGLGKKQFWHNILTESRKQYFTAADEDIAALFII